MLVLLWWYVALSILLSILVCAVASLFGICLVSVHVPVRYAIAGNTRELYHCLFIQMTRLNLKILSMHLLAVASRPRLSKIEPKWFIFDTSCYAFGGRVRRVAKLNVNKLNFFYCIVFILVTSSSIRCTLSLY